MTTTKPQWREALNDDAASYEKVEQERRDIERAEKLNKVFLTLHLPFTTMTPVVKAGGYTWRLSNDAENFGHLYVQRGEHTVTLWLTDGIGTPFSVDSLRYSLKKRLDELDDRVGEIQ